MNQERTADVSISAEELMSEYEKLKKNNFPSGETLDFIYKLGDSQEIELHFELVLEDEKRPRGKRLYPGDSFRHHGEAGLLYLSRLLNSEDREYSVSAAYLMAELLPRGRYPNQEQLKDGLNEALVRLAEAEEAEYRRKCLIALGWVGTENEIPTLKNHLLNDPDSLCRAWSASSFMQMSGRVSCDIIKEKTIGVLISCLENETDVFARGVAVETIQDIWRVRLGLRSSAVEERNERAVDRAARRALEYLRRETEVRA